MLWDAGFSFPQGKEAWECLIAMRLRGTDPPTKIGLSFENRTETTRTEGTRNNNNNDNNKNLDQRKRVELCK